MATQFVAMRSAQFVDSEFILFFYIDQNSGSAVAAGVIVLYDYCKFLTISREVTYFLSCTLVLTLGLESRLVWVSL